MRPPSSFLFVAVFVAAGAIAPTPAAAAPSDAPSGGEVVVAAGALALLSPASAFAGALAALDDALGDARAVVTRATQTAAFVRNGTIRCPVPNLTEIVDNFGEWRGGHSHTGVDIRALHGLPVRAVLPSVVLDPGDAGAYGLMLRMRDMAGNVWFYAHLSSVRVAPGDTVAAGEIVGTVGCSGRCSGPHLHIELRPDDGVPVDAYPHLVPACAPRQRVPAPVVPDLAGDAGPARPRTDRL